MDCNDMMITSNVVNDLASNTKFIVFVVLLYESWWPTWLVKLLQIALLVICILMIWWLNLALKIFS